MLSPLSPVRQQMAHRDPKAFLDVNTSADKKKRLTIRMGRQELEFGSGHYLSASEVFNVRRSFAGDYSPIYQAAYMLGGLQFWALRQELVESGKMTDREFHDSILKAGPMPVSVVRSRLTGQSPKPDLPAEWRFYPALNQK